jgi:2-haloacid dehalogenase
VAGRIPLVILSNAMVSQNGRNVDKLGAPFHRVYTAEQAQAYKPRFRAFEYMLDQLGAKPEEMMHVSSSFRYDQMSAFDLHFGARVWVNRGHEPRNPSYITHEIADIGGLSGCVGL